MQPPKELRKVHHAIQQQLKVEKQQRSGIKYKVRSAADIIKQLKPILEGLNAEVLLSDSIEKIGERIYVKATAMLVCEHGSISTEAYAREPESQGGMSAEQITGAASSYARKYALSGLFLLDDNVDADTPEYQIQRDMAINASIRKEIAEAESVVELLKKYRIWQKEYPQHVANGTELQKQFTRRKLELQEGARENDTTDNAD